MQKRSASSVSHGRAVWRARVHWRRVRLENRITYVEKKQFAYEVNRMRTADYWTRGLSLYMTDGDDKLIGLQPVTFGSDPSTWIAKFGYNSF